MSTEFIIAALLTCGFWFVITQQYRQQSLLNRITLVDSKNVSSQQISNKFKGLLFELGDFLDLFSVALSSGDSVFNSLGRVTIRAQGTLASEFEILLRGVELGESLENELEDLAKRLPQQQVVEMCNKFILALQRGTPLSEMLQSQAESVRSEIRNQIAKQAGKNETRMLIPLVFLILPVTVLFAIYPSLQLLNFQNL
jgi:tight adherence protein C